MHITVKILNPALGPFSVYQLLTGSLSNIQAPGVTITPSKPPINTTLSGRPTASYLNVQNSNSSAAGSIVYVGDANTTANGTCQEADLAIGAGYLMSSPATDSIPLINRYVNANQANAVINIGINQV